jgi:glycolate oxidase iron-sulfur subunit
MVAEPLRPAGQHAALDDVRPTPEELTAACVHCGFCLPTCPTYVLWGEEMDSPRGRIDLMQQSLAGEPLTPTMVGHFDACLGCLACVSACPSGVRYDQLIEATRATVERRHRRRFSDWLRRALLFRLFPYPDRLRQLRGLLVLGRALGLNRLAARSALLRRLSPTLAALAELAPAPGRAKPIPERTYCRRYPRRVVGLLTGCVQGAFFPQVNAATVRVLSAERCDVICPPKQGCCGALSYHSGREEEARRFARGVVDTFGAARVDVVVTNSAGCGSALKAYGDLLRDDPAYAARAAELAAKVRDVTEVLGELEPVAERHPLPVVAAYQDACHLAHGQGVRSQPRSLLGQIPDLRLADVAEPDMCCGSAGVYNLLNPEPAAELGDRKAARVLETGAEVLVTGNPGCALQIAAAARRAGRPLQVAHTIEVLDASISGTGPAALLGRKRAAARPAPE